MAETFLLEELRLIPGLRVKVNEPLAPYTSMKIGGPADYFLTISDRAALSQTLRALQREGIFFCLLGKGSNVLVSDLGVRGAVLRLDGEFKQRHWHMEEGKARVSVGAACSLPQLVREAVKRGFSGLEFAEGIPGTVGGALVMNAGAYGSEIEKIVERVEGVTRSGEPVGVDRAEMAFSYRDSHLPAGTIVTEVRLRLSRGDAAEMNLKIRELVAKRKKSQPSGHPNSGSMFRNPPGDFAGRLIEAAGLKGKIVGRAEISERHANFIVNLGGASAEDVRGLMEFAQQEVERRFSIRLQPEVRWLGEWPSGSGM
ncbi:MAG: UDP-N-acetylmuramate dehydrogenase [Deltaproteobacteria bacterium]|nr:UDP-N-acetylmuramate dehydrogenase [Deltaproteobacteria bacterium]